MKINNTSIRGFYIYSDTSLYEEGDFVVYGNTIYVCSPKSGSSLVIGEKPYESDNFYVYLGDQLADETDFLEFSQNGGGKDKYISLASLVNILNTYMKGLSTSGIIGHEYVLNEDNSVVYKIENNITKVFNEDEASQILTTLLYDEKINHGIFKVSRHLPELKTLVGDTGDYCILRQYSYYRSEDKDSLVRVQEIIDIESSRQLNPSISYANIYYRSVPLKPQSNEIIDLRFYSATAHSEYLARKAENLFNIYSTKIQLFQSKIRELEKSFCFKSILTGSVYSRVDLQNTNEKGRGYVNVDTVDEIGPLTVNVLIKSEDGTFYKSETLTVDPSLGDRNYYISDDLYLSVNVDDSGDNLYSSTTNTPLPNTTTPVPISDTTTPIPDTTTPSPTSDTTTPIPDTTTPVPISDTTTPVPDITTPSPISDTTTPIPDITTTTTSGTATPIPNTTTTTTTVVPMDTPLVVLELMGRDANKSTISSIYYRKYFNS